jgi:predicted P-loop ATPase
MKVVRDAWGPDPTACVDCGKEACEGHPDPIASDEQSTNRSGILFTGSEISATRPRLALKPATAHEFARDKDGRIVPTVLQNIRLALAKLGVAVAFDSFAREVQLNGKPLTDVAIDQLWVQIDDEFKFRPPKETLRTLVVADAHKTHVHPVRDYLDALTWDSRPRLDTWLVHYGGAGDSAYVLAVGALTLIAAVRRARRPGCKFDELLILESKQGTLKSSALRALCPVEDWFSDDLPLGVDSKVVIERTAGRWIIEAAELHGNRGREAEALKSFLSRQVDGPVRLAYDRLPTTVPRQFILIGTTNSRLAYLKDMTGARRFWPVTIEAFDVSALMRDRDQLWAEAAAREAAGASIRLDPTLWADAAIQQEDRRAADPWEALLEPLMEGDGMVVDYVPVTTIWHALKMEANHLDNRHADRVAAIVQRHGFTRKKRMRVDGKPELCWVRNGVER